MLGTRMHGERLGRGALLAVVGGAVALIAVGVAAVLALAGSSDGPPAFQGSPTAPGSNATNDATASPTPGLNARTILLGPDIDFPPDTAMWVVLGPWGKDGGPFSIQRVYRIGDAPVQREVLFPPEAVQGDGYAGNVADDVFPTSFMFQPVTSSLIAAICYGRGCGFVGGTGGLPARTVFYESTNGGSTWRETLARDGRWWLRGTHREQLLAVNYDGPVDRTGILVPSGDAFTWPEGLDPWYTGASTVPLFPGGDLRYSDQNHDSIVNDVPAIEFKPDVPIDAFLTLVHPLKQGVSIAAAFVEDNRRENYEPFDPPPPPRRFFGVFSGTGEVRDLFEFPSEIGITGLAGMLDSTHILGTIEYAARASTCTSGGTNSGTAPAIFDTETGVVQFIPDPFLDPACPGGSHVVIAFQQGDLARVDTPGDCLNLRDQAGADGAVITCIPHGTIVRNQGAVWDGQWTDVRLFDGTQGWASVDYLDKGPRRQPPAGAMQTLRENLPPGPISIVGACIDYSETYTEGWCYMDVEVEGDTVRLKLGVVASDHVFDVSLRRNGDGSYTLVSMVELKGV